MTPAATAPATALALACALAAPHIALAQPKEPAAVDAFPVVELRDYTLKPGQRDVLIALFEREFIESQRATGMEVLAHFRDLDRPDRFVWFRGFRSMDARGQALPAFYLHGAAWRRHREAANATMIDSDNVRLLQPVAEGSGFAMGQSPHPPFGAAPSRARVLLAIHPLVAPADDAVRAWFASELVPCLERAGARILARYVTEPAVNNFPRLPVREDGPVLVWAARFDQQAALDRYLRTQADAGGDACTAGAARWLRAPVELRRLAPAARSRVR